MEGTKGVGTKRAVEDIDVDQMAKLLKGSPLDFEPLNAKEEKAMEKGKVPKRIEDRLNTAFLANLALTIATQSAKDVKTYMHTKTLVYLQKCNIANTKPIVYNFIKCNLSKT